MLFWLWSAEQIFLTLCGSLIGVRRHGLKISPQHFDAAILLKTVRLSALKYVLPIVLIQW